MADEPRNRILDRLIEDLVGPMAADEESRDRPGDRYLTGILWPLDTAVPAEEDERLAANVEEDDEASCGEDPSVPLVLSKRPSSAGLSFAVKPVVGASLDFTIRCGTYRAVQSGGDRETGSAREDPRVDEEKPRGSRQRHLWRRASHEVTLRVGLVEGGTEVPVPELPGLSLYVLCTRHPESLGITAVLQNRNVEGTRRIDTEERSFFQVSLVAQPVGTRLMPRPARRRPVHEDDWSAALIYRDAQEYAVGHTCAATWTLDPDGVAIEVATTWLPQATVPAVSAEGGEALSPLREGTASPLSAAWLENAPLLDLVIGLRLLPTLYESWLQTQATAVDTLVEEFRPRAKQHIAAARECSRRMLAAVDLIATDPTVERAFRLSARAMRLQRRWTRGEPDLIWRPFQLAFQLLALRSIVDMGSPDRRIMDLLWFPTGGGKTEAYLGLVAFTLFFRRMTRDGSDAAGVAVLMRYTLRLLTIQQFQRAAALVLACEYLRRTLGGEGGVPGGPLAIGLWVGGGATPNTVKEASFPTQGSEATAEQLQTCPACALPLTWRADKRPDAMKVYCENDRCELASTGRHLPVWTVDEDIYRERPALLIGTVDKFAQIVRKSETRVLFGLDGASGAPDLIIQDELHLISGPLGTVTALYEVAIDRLCARNGIRPKIIGSTATIRRASDQVSALFNRETFQFPPPILNADDSCFASVDGTRPGRRYLGVTTAGRSPKFALQAVCASLMQSILMLPLTRQERDWYWTLVAYFNSLRELGAALVLMLDDVQQSMNEFAGRRPGERPRQIGVPTELTSRLRSAEIPVILKNLETLRAGDTGAYDVLLASNMISVGVDVDRLNLMVVSGQPKGMAEYIQATSRVGRKWPGQVVCVYNHGRIRDRSHYEGFATWHSMLYREVEATSVTPFASRAQDRALHAVVVALARHLVPGMLEDPTLTRARRGQVEALSREITDRVAAIATEADELGGVEQKIGVLLDEWEARGKLKHYWNDYDEQEALLVSAEERAATEAAGRGAGAAWATPNSMRGVEPGTQFRLVNSLRVDPLGKPEDVNATEQ